MNPTYIMASIPGRRRQRGFPTFLFLLPLLVFVLGTLVLFAPAHAYACTPGGSDCGAGMSCEYLDGSYGCIANATGSGTNTGSNGTGSGTNTGQSGGSSGSFFNPLSTGTSLTALLTGILQLVIRIGTVAIILMLVYTGFMFVMARGDSGAITKARNALMWTVIGALILLGSAALAQGICATVVALGSGSGSCPALLI